MQRKKPVPTPITIDGYDLLWTLTRDTQWVSENDHQGITISVRKAGPERRELVMKYPYIGAKISTNWRLPDRPKVTPTIVEKGIRAAMEVGWDPDERGKPFMVDIAEEDLNG
jgi:hypothetical protein